jgi:peptide/nickel transport system ATP-binding protein
MMFRSRTRGAAPAVGASSYGASSDGDVIELRNVDKIYQTRRGPLQVLTDISFRIAPGQVLALVGESGCGKSTTGKIVTGLIEPSAGQLLFQGKDVTTLQGGEADYFRREVQIIHQDPYASLNPARTIFQILSAPLQQHKVARGRNQLVEKVLELLERVSLTPAADFIEKFPHQLSGGQRQRLVIARTLTVEPDFIVADESVSMLDVSIRMSIVETLLTLKRELNVGFVFITHDLAIARHFAWDGHMGVMYLGRIIEMGPTQQVIGDPQHPYTRALLGAIPEADPDVTRTKERMQLRSLDIPSLFNVPAGCSFHPRCPFFEEGLCDTLVPPLYDVKPNQRSACHVIARDVAGIQPVGIDAIPVRAG